jgi:hypothetical protein
VDNSIGIIGDLAAVVTVAGIAIYVMGLIGLSVTIFKVTDDFSTAWYAVSLLPRTVVAGQGVRLWLRWPLIAMAILLPTARLGSTYLVVLGVTALYVVLIVPVALRSLRDGLRSAGFFPFVRILARGLAYTLPLGIGVLALFDGVFYLAQNPSLHPGLITDALGILLRIDLDENSIAVGIAFILLGGFTLGIPSAMWSRPPLPRVWLKMNKEESAATKDKAPPSVVWLVAHNEGFWHLLLEKSGELQSIPDEQVLVARTGGKDHATPAKKEAASTEKAPREEDTKPGVGEDR